MKVYLVRVRDLTPGLRYITRDGDVAEVISVTEKTPYSRVESRVKNSGTPFTALYLSDLRVEVLV